MKRHLALNVARSISASEELSRAKKRARVGNEIRFFLFSRNGKNEDKRAYFLLLASSNWMTTSSNNVQQSDMLAAQ